MRGEGRGSLSAEGWHLEYRLSLAMGEGLAFRLDDSSASSWSQKSRPQLYATSVTQCGGECLQNETYQNKSVAKRML